MIGIINYGAGNIFSLTAALKRMNLEYGMVNTPGDLDQYSHIIIPGVGHAGAAMQKLTETGLPNSIKALKKPVLGICVGMQLLTTFSEEGNSELLDIFPLSTRLFPRGMGLKIPHMGWNRIDFKNNILFKDVAPETQFYFVHSYFVEYNPIFDIAAAHYGTKFSSAIQKNNFYGVQFHPEKSGKAGELLLRNFSTLTSTDVYNSGN